MAAAAPLDSHKSQFTNRLVVGYVDGVTPATAVDAGYKQRLSRSMDATRQLTGPQVASVTQSRSGARILHLDREVSIQTAQAMAARLLKTEPGARYVEPDLRAYAFSVQFPNDPGLASQWHLVVAGAGSAAGAAFASVWGAVPTPAAKTVVAVIDSGYLPHGDMGNEEIQALSFIGDAATAGGVPRGGAAVDPGDYCLVERSDSSWHGLKVASLIAAKSDNGRGVAGAAGQYVRVLHARVLGRCGAWTTDIADAIRWAAGGTVAGLPTNTTPARVLNLSIGTAAGQACPAHMQDAVNYAHETAGALVVAAAGNEGKSLHISSPANCAHVVAVGAHTKSGDLASYSNRSGEIALTAPGGGGCLTQWSPCQDDGIPVLSNTGLTTAAADIDMFFFGGTSAATPLVAAAAGMLFALDPTLTNSQVRSHLLASARPHLSQTFCSANSGLCGTGMLDAYAAVARITQPTVALIGSSGALLGRSYATFQAVMSGPAALPVRWVWTQATGPAVVVTQNDASASSTIQFQMPALRGESITFTLKATTATGQTVSDARTVRVNNAPVLTPPGSHTLSTGGSLYFRLMASDPDGDDTSYVLATGPAGVVVDSVSGVVGWNNPMAGTHSIEVYATDGELRSPTQTLTVVNAGPATLPPPATTPPGDSGNSGTGNTGGRSGGDTGGGSMSLYLVLLLGAANLMLVRRRSCPGTHPEMGEPVESKKPT